MLMSGAGVVVTILAAAAAVVVIIVVIVWQALKAAVDLSMEQHPWASTCTRATDAVAAAASTCDGWHSVDSDVTM